jgi:hypothetical protein
MWPTLHDDLLSEHPSNTHSQAHLGPVIFNRLSISRPGSGRQPVREDPETLLEYTIGGELCCRTPQSSNLKTSILTSGL